MRQKKARGLQGEVKPDESCILKLISSRRGGVRPTPVAELEVEGDVSYFV
jgi:hypothetical protein